MIVEQNMFSFLTLRQKAPVIRFWIAGAFCFKRKKCMFKGNNIVVTALFFALWSAVIINLVNNQSYNDSSN